MHACMPWHLVVVTSLLRHSTILQFIWFSKEFVYMHIMSSLEIFTDYHSLKINPASIWWVITIFRLIEGESVLEFTCGIDLKQFIAFRVIQVKGDWWEGRDDALSLGGVVIHFCPEDFSWSSSDWVNFLFSFAIVYMRDQTIIISFFFVWLKMNPSNEKLYLWHQFRAFPFRVIQVIGHRAVRDAWLLGWVMIGCQGFLGVHSIQ